MEITRFDIKKPELDVDKNNYEIVAEDMIEVDNYTVDCLIFLNYHFEKDSIGDSSIRDGVQEIYIEKLKKIDVDILGIDKNGEEVLVTETVKKQIIELIKNEIKDKI